MINLYSQTPEEGFVEFKGGGNPRISDLIYVLDLVNPTYTVNN
jgi:hypothetical protein